MENTSDSFMPGSLLFCMKSKKSVCYSVADNTGQVRPVFFIDMEKRYNKFMLKKNVCSDKIIRTERGM